MSLHLPRTNQPTTKHPCAHVVMCTQKQTNVGLLDRHEKKRPHIAEIYTRLMMKKCHVRKTTYLHTDGAQASKQASYPDASSHTFLPQHCHDRSFTDSTVSRVESILSRLLLCIVVRKLLPEEAVVDRSRAIACVATVSFIMMQRTMYGM